MAAIQQNTLEEAIKDLKVMTPSPMNTMLQKQSKEDAIKKAMDRKQMSAVDVPPTAMPGKTKNIWKDI